MQREWVKYLCDPIDKTGLKIDKVFKKRGKEILFGTLKSRSGNRYSIKEGVPILLNRHTQPVSTVDSFAYEWENFDFDYGRGGWLKDIIRPAVGGLTFFKNKVVIDCGAGSGRQSRWMAEAGAKFVFCIELSNSVHSIIKKVTKGYKDKIFIIQADISQIPIDPKKIDIDVIYCVNVIQHTKGPRQTLIELSKLLKRNSDVIFNIYLTRGRDLSLKTVNLSRALTKFLPKQILKYFSLVVACILYPVYRLGHSFKEMWLDIYDLLGSHEYQRFYTEKELKSILREAKLKIIERTKYAFLLKKVV